MNLYEQQLNMSNKLYRVMSSPTIFLSMNVCVLGCLKCALKCYFAAKLKIKLEYVLCSRE